MTTPPRGAPSTAAIVGLVLAVVVALVVGIGVWRTVRDTTPDRAGPSRGPGFPDRSSPTVVPTVPVSGADRLPVPVEVGVYGNPGSYWPGNGITNAYLSGQQNGSAFPQAKLRGLLARGVSLDITISAKYTPYLAELADDQSPAMAWLTAYVRNVGALAAYGRSLHNGTYVVATIFHEAQAQIAKGFITGSSADFATVGRAQQRAIALGKQLAPDAYWSVWLVGHDRQGEGEQLAQITDPKPDLISFDPYANRSCDDSLQTVAADDANWIREQPAYAGTLAISETGMPSTCTDDQLAAYYTDIRAQLAELGPDVLFYIMFNSDYGSFPHQVTAASHPLAVEALMASLGS